MKKLFVVLALAGVMAACGGNEKKLSDAEVQEFANRIIECEMTDSEDDDAELKAEFDKLSKEDQARVKAAYEKMSE